ncbi:hypothetical protein ABZ397_29625 [Streptomyces sp. NPDC005876]|uniref:hypothetical protein n=1 Tax=Streptomyces sp. NPDC005876 TaxID=3157076 RepID=UPI0033C1BD37
MRAIFNRFAGRTRLLARLVVGASILTMTAVGSVSPAVTGESTTYGASAVSAEGDTGWGLVRAVATGSSDTGWGSASA